MSKPKIKKPIKKIEKDEEFFVGIKDPVDVRRNLLESLKEIVTLQQKYETFKNMREEKIETINEMKKNIRDMSNLLSKLKTVLPSLPEKHIPKVTSVKVETEKQEKKDTKKIEIKQSKVSDEIDKLESELAEIEGKLSRL